MAEQLILDFPHYPRRLRETLIVGGHNKQAVDMVDKYPHWADMVQLIYGAPATGKKHLLTIWCDISGAHMVDAAFLAQKPADIWLGKAGLAVFHLERLTQKGAVTLFHLINMAREMKRPLLLSAACAPQKLPLLLADLASRLCGLVGIEIKLPDDAILEAILRKTLRDRQLTLDDKLINYIMPRITREPEFIDEFVAILDQNALATKRPVNRSQIATLLQNHETHFIK